MGEAKVVLFDLKHTGHHASYIKHLIKHWQTFRPQGKLCIVVSPKFIEQHQSVVDLATEDNASGVEFIPISSSEYEEIKNSKNLSSRIKCNLREWELLCCYTAQLKATHCLIMYLDTCEIPLLFRLKPPCPISGIYFRPTFHYKQFANYQPSKGEWIQQLRQRLFLHQTLHNPQLHTLFCLDPLVDETITKMYPSARAIPLADPVEISGDGPLDQKALLEKNNISEHRKIFLLFGSIDGRKGIYKLLEALENLSPEICQKVCLLIVGHANVTEQNTIRAKIFALCQHSSVQVITHFDFLTDLEVQAYFQLADVVLALYQRHVGMSGILLLAAASQKPVISSNYGLMGELVRRYELGLAIDSTDPENIAEGLTKVFEPDGISCNYDKMKSFAHMNSTTKFAETIFNSIL